jgi:hypothetical protein
VLVLAFAFLPGKQGLRSSSENFLCHFLTKFSSSTTFPSLHFDLMEFRNVVIFSFLEVPVLTSFTKK